nr:hypothetical protein [Streptomyces sp. HNM0574]
MLYCRRAAVRVLWIGPARTPGGAGPVYACAPCLAELDRMVRLQERDRGADYVPARGDVAGAVNFSVPPYRGRPAEERREPAPVRGRHRRTGRWRRWLGRAGRRRD